MIGHSELMAMRIDGFVPLIVWVQTDPEFLVKRFDALFPMDPDHMQIVVEPTDNPRRIDLRGVYGLICVVRGCDAQRVEAVTAACVCAGAARVITNTHARIRRCEFETTKVTDTTGVLTWPTS